MSAAVRDERGIDLKGRGCTHLELLVERVRGLLAAAALRFFSVVACWMKWLETRHKVFKRIHTVAGGRATHVHG